MEEAEAFLTGRYAEVAQSAAAQSAAAAVPAWARVNWVTHADPSAIRRWVLRSTSDGRLGAWSWAVETLARELFALADGDIRRMADLQRGCLVPLELSLMGPSFATVLPSDVVALGRIRMRSHPAAHRGGTRVPPPTER